MLFIAVIQYPSIVSGYLTFQHGLKNEALTIGVDLSTAKKKKNNKKKTTTTTTKIVGHEKCEKITSVTRENVEKKPALLGIASDEI